MNPTDFIIGLMKENTDALGFIPRPTVDRQFVANDRYILQLNRFRKPIGYLLHGPRHADGRMHVAQACIQLDKRNAGFGSAVVDQLLSRATAAAATDIFLRCAQDLESCKFWSTAGFTPIAFLPGGRRRRRTIVRFHFSLAAGAPPLPAVPLQPRSELPQAVFDPLSLVAPGSQQRKTKGNSLHLTPPYTLNSR